MKHVIDMPMQEYLAQEALSSGLIATMFDRCPKAAWWDSWLNPDREQREFSKVADMGTLIHELVLEQSANTIKVIDPEQHPSKTGSVPKGWTNDAIRKARDDAKAAGLIPILPEDFKDAQAIAELVKDFIYSMKGGTDVECMVYDAFADGYSESTLLFDVNGVACRARPDRLATSNNVVVDIKTTSASAEPSTWARMNGYTQAHADVTTALYRRGVQSVFGLDREPRYVFLVVETVAPYLCSLVECDATALAVGEAKVERATRLWKQCTDTNTWPAYPQGVIAAEYPHWLLSKWEEYELTHSK